MRALHSRSLLLASWGQQKAADARGLWAEGRGAPPQTPRLLQGAGQAHEPRPQKGPENPCSELGV